MIRLFLAGPRDAYHEYSTAYVCLCVCTYTHAHLNMRYILRPAWQTEHPHKCKISATGSTRNDELQVPCAIYYRHKKALRRSLSRIASGILGNEFLGTSFLGVAMLRSSCQESFIWVSKDDAREGCSFGCPVQEWMRCALRVKERINAVHHLIERDYSTRLLGFLILKALTVLLRCKVSTKVEFS